MLKSPWKELIAFIDAREPGFAGRVRGASEEEVRRVQAQTPVPLPHAYADFLRAMGGDLAHFRVFPNHFGTVSELVEHRESSSEWPFDYPPERFLPIGYEWERDDELEGDVCLALQLGDAQDPPVVIIDPTAGANPKFTMTLAASFCEYVQRRAFAQYERLRRAHSLRLNTSIKVPEGTWSRTVAVLQQLGFCQALPGAAASWFGQSSDASVWMHSKDGVLAAEFVSDDGPALERAAEGLQDSVELAWKSKWMRREYSELR